MKNEELSPPGEGEDCMAALWLGGSGPGPFAVPAEPNSSFFILHSVMAGPALDGGAVVLVAGDAVAHLEGADLADLAHAADLAVAGFAGDAGRDVGGVGEAGVIRDVVDADPVDGLLVGPGGAELLDLAAVLGG